MKRVFSYLITALVLTVFLLPACAAAKDFSEAERHAMADLTEVYSYTQAEADAFIFEVTETDTQWQVTFYPPGHPTWVYTSANDKQTGQFISSSTPFHVDGFSAYPGEGSIRDGLRTARANGWFTGMSAERRAMFLDWMEQWGVQPNDALYSGLMNGSLTTAQAVNEYFKSCYGEPETWPQPLLEWRDEELASYGFTAEDATTPAAAQPTPQPTAPGTQGITRYETQTRTGKQPLTVTEFVGETPDELAQALSHPMLKGYVCLCGAYQQGEITNDNAMYDTGLLALEKDGARLLVTLRRTAETETWTVMPVGEKALFSDGLLYITYNAKENLYTLACSRSDTETESFRVRVQYNPVSGILCRLQDYQHVNTATGESTTIEAGDNRVIAADGEWYSVTTTAADGVTTTEQIPALIPPYLDYTDADAFPKSAEACRADTGYALPDGYAVSCGVHLRAKTSSHSSDLGTYSYGTLLEVLDTRPGDPYPWYHVRIGSVEGYMASVYVDYPGSPCAMKPLEKYPPLTVAKARKNISLKKGTGLFAGTVTKLPAGTKMHVLAERDGWLHVMVPQNGEPGWMMDLNGADGYVKAADVITAATAQQLDWLE